MGIRIFIGNIEVTKLKVSKRDAARIVGCSRNRFDFLYVDTGLIMPVKDRGEGRDKFWVQDIIALRDRQFEAESQKKRSRVIKRKINFDRIIDECNREVFAN